MIEVIEVSKKYIFENYALDKVNLVIEKGDFVAVLGNNGAGKSTLFKIITGIITDYDGLCNVFGKKAGIEFANKISYMPEMRGLDGRSYVLEHLTDLLCYKGYNRKEAEKRIIQWLDKFDMMKYRYHRVGQLSKGNQQKLQIILAIANNPEILIIDEPYSGLDVITCNDIWNILLELNRSGCTILFSSHEIDSKLLRCNRYVFIREGRIVLEGSLEDIRGKYKKVLELDNVSFDSERVKDIIGENFLEKRDSYTYIEVDNEEMAAAIFDRLEVKFSRRFLLRDKSLEEIYYLINKG